MFTELLNESSLNASDQVTSRTVMTYLRGATDRCTPRKARADNYKRPTPAGNDSSWVDYNTQGMRVLDQEGASQSNDIAVPREHFGNMSDFTASLKM